MTEDMNNSLTIHIDSSHKQQQVAYKYSSSPHKPTEMWKLRTFQQQYINNKVYIYRYILWNKINWQIYQQNRLIVKAGHSIEAVSLPLLGSNWQQNANE